MKQMIYRNLRNENKYLEVVRYDCGHYYMRPFMQWITPVTLSNGYVMAGVRNNLGGRDDRFRVQKRNYLSWFLNDYELIMEVEK